MIDNFKQTSAFSTPDPYLTRIWKKNKDKKDNLKNRGAAENKMRHHSLYFSKHLQGLHVVNITRQ